MRVISYIRREDPNCVAYNVSDNERRKNKCDMKS
jgi:hypothetical protein